MEEQDLGLEHAVVAWLESKSRTATSDEKKELLLHAVGKIRSALDLKQGEKGAILDLESVWSAGKAFGVALKGKESLMEEADKLKEQGNEKLRSGDPKAAIDLYSKAIDVYPDGFAYFCNRAAAHSKLGAHEEAVKDCERAISLNPNYTKAYSRLGFALFSMGKYREAVERGYAVAVQLEPSNPSHKEALASAEARAMAEEQEGQEEGSRVLPSESQHSHAHASQQMPDLSALAGMLNPQMLQQSMTMMSEMFGGGVPPRQDADSGEGERVQHGPSGGLADILGNPQLMAAAQQMMQDPAIQQMAEQFFGGGPPQSGGGEGGSGMGEVSDEEEGV